MTVNLGSFDRVVRLVVGIALALAPLLNAPIIWSSAPFAYASMGVGLVLIVTALIRFCPLYRILGVSTCKL